MASWGVPTRVILGVAFHMPYITRDEVIAFCALMEASAQWAVFCLIQQKKPPKSGTGGMIMADLIERESLNKWCHETMKAQTTVEGMSYIRTFWDAVNAVPNVDAVPLVRCKDCRRFFRYAEGYKQSVENADGDCGMLLFGSISTKYARRKADDFCSYGKRRDDDAAD